VIGPRHVDYWFVSVDARGVVAVVSKRCSAVLWWSKVHGEEEQQGSDR